MALDFHMANNKKEALYQSANVSFEFELHQEIFNCDVLEKGDFPFFRRLNNFFEDTKYNTDELSRFIKENEEIRTLFFKSPQVIEKINNLLGLVKEAQSKNLSIWVFCD